MQYPTSISPTMVTVSREILFSSRSGLCLNTALELHLAHLPLPIILQVSFFQIYASTSCLSSSTTCSTMIWATGSQKCIVLPYILPICHVLFCWLYRIAFRAALSNRFLVFTTWETIRLVVGRFFWLSCGTYTCNRRHSGHPISSRVYSTILDTR